MNHTLIFTRGGDFVFKIIRWVVAAGAMFVATMLVIGFFISRSQDEDKDEALVEEPAK